MEKTEIGTDIHATTSQARPVTGSDNESPPTNVTKQNGIFPSEVTKITTKRAAKLAKNKTNKVYENPTLALTMNDKHQDDNGAKDTCLFSPGAVSVPGTNSSLGFSSNDQQASASEVVPGVQSSRSDRAPSLVVAAQLVAHHNEEYDQDEDLENRIEREVELRLKKRDPTLVVAEVLPPSISTICKQFCWKWKYLLLLILLCICGTFVGIKLSERSDKNSLPQPTRKSTRNNEIQARIRDVLDRYVPIKDDPTNESPQSRAWEWLLFNDTNNLMRNGTVSDTVILERYVLAVLFYSTTGPRWWNQFHFMTERSVCSWNSGYWPSLTVASPKIYPAHGVSCDTETNVQMIWLSENGLDGIIPSELSLLSNLQSLYLLRNALENTIPTELGQLTKLQGLGLEGNVLNGTLPTEFGRLTVLSDLQLHGNNFLQGTMPTELGNLAALKYFSLSVNKLTGILPTELGKLTSLRDLQVQYNTMHGRLPTELGNLVAIEYLDLNENLFTGTLPTEIGQLISLKRLTVSHNFLHGTIPEEIKNNMNLQVYFEPQKSP